MPLETLEKVIGYQFKNPDLLFRALTHRSYLNEHREKNFASNERIEFLGDAVLELVISQKIFTDYPNLPEGDLTALRSKIVCTKNLALIAKEIDLGKNLMLSRGEDEGGGRNNQTLLANCLEAIIGAIYLDGGLESSTNFIQDHFYSRIPEIFNQNLKDAKSLFQEIAQEKERITPIYKVMEEQGPDHSKIFTVGVMIENRLIAKAQGHSKQEAEENAAKLALENYR